MFDTAQFTRAVNHYRQGELQQALAITREMVEKQVIQFDLFHLHALLSLESGDYASSLDAFERADALRPDYPPLLLSWGNYYQRIGDMKTALSCYDRAIAGQSDYADAHYNRGNILALSGDMDGAITAFERVLQLNPNHTAARNNLGSVLIDRGDIDAAIATLQQTLQLRRNYTLAHSNLLCAMHYHPDITATDLAVQFRQWRENNFINYPPITKTATADQRPLKMGLLSGALHTHPALWLSIAAFEQLNREQFALYGYSFGTKPDRMTARLRQCCVLWRELSNQSDAAITAQIRRDEIDILIDMAGHMQGRPLVAVMRAAPVQVKWVGGLFNTTGIKQMDWLISDEVETPEGCDAGFTEQIYRMPHSYICYSPPQISPPVTELPALKTGQLTLGCFNNPAKINQKLVIWWAKILRQLPQSRLLLKGKAYCSSVVKTRLRQWFQLQGVASERIIFETFSPHAELLNTYGKIDLALDPWPYSGGLTTIEALWMGVPTVTLPRPTFAGRHAASHLVNAGLGDWVVDSEAAYVEKVVWYSGHLEQLSELRRDLRQRLLDSPLCDARQFTRDFERGLLRMWHQYCDHQNILN
ncbi:tetratricopeptide repeat protein [Ectothiorhodospiraceae bacterium BW-2]|nr:tetratricopeptide repeat protein [Ectothiorhodospiraceae bacterium BW-2]